jgi:serine/threonine-protein kinase
MSVLPWRAGERYEVSSRIAESANGATWRGRDTATGADCLVKVLRPELVPDPGTLAQLRQELAAVAGLGHPGIAAVAETVEHDGRVALVSRFVAGRSVRSLLDDGLPLPADRATAIASQVASVLAAAHTHGIAHGNLTPAQVLIETGRAAPGEAVVTDFGLAALINRAAALGAVPFVPLLRYQAPELRQGDPGSPAADVFALGVLFYETLSGRHPFAISREDDAILVVRDTPEAIAGLSLSLWHLISGCLAPNPINRPTAAAIARLLASHVPPAPVPAEAAAATSATVPAPRSGAHPATAHPASAQPAPAAAPQPSFEDGATIFMPVIRTRGDLAPSAQAEGDQGAAGAEGSPNGDRRARRRATPTRRRVVLSGLGLSAVAVVAVVAFTGVQSGGANATTGKDVPVLLVPHSGEASVGAGAAAGSARASASASTSAHATASASASVSASASASHGAVGPLAVGATSATPSPSASSAAAPTTAAGTAPASGTTLVNAHSNTCLDTQNGAFANGTTEQLWTCGSAPGESWTLTANGALAQDGGAYCLDDYNFGTVSGSRVVLWSCNNGSNQRWTLRADGSLQNSYSGLCLDVAGQSTANGAQIQLTTCGWHSSQHWSWR